MPFWSISTQNGNHSACWDNYGNEVAYFLPVHWWTSWSSCVSSNGFFSEGEESRSGCRWIFWRTGFVRCCQLSGIALLAYFLPVDENSHSACFGNHFVWKCWWHSYFFPPPLLQIFPSAPTFHPCFGVFPGCVMVFQFILTLFKVGCFRWYIRVYFNLNKKWSP